MDLHAVVRFVPLFVAPFLLYTVGARRPRLLAWFTGGVAVLCAVAIVYEVGFLVALYRFPGVVLVAGDQLSVETLTILRRVWRLPAVASLLLSLLLGTSAYLRWLLAQRLGGGRQRQAVLVAAGAILAAVVTGLGTIVLILTELGPSSLLVGNDALSAESLQLIRQNATIGLAVRVAISTALGLAWLRVWFGGSWANASDRVG